MSRIVSRAFVLFTDAKAKRFKTYAIVRNTVVKSPQRKTKLTSFLVKMVDMCRKIKSFFSLPSMLLII